MEKSMRIENFFFSSWTGTFECEIKNKGKEKSNSRY